MNILFVYSLTYFRLKNKQLVADSIQLGISYISSFLKKRSHKTKLVVLSRFQGKKNFKIVDKYIKSFQPKLICFTAVTSEYYFIVSIAKYIKLHYPEIFLLIGGPHVSLNPENVLLDGFDALCIGEGEYPTLELVEQLQSGFMPSIIQNLWIKHGQNVEKNPSRPFIENLDSLFFPDRQIWQEWIDHKEERYSVLLGRGCPFQCTYCCNHALKGIAPGKYVRLRSTGNIMEEVNEMVDQLLIKNEIFLEVETLAINKDWAIELCAKLEHFNKTLSQPISFGANLRIMPGTDLSDLFLAMKNSNFKFINIGLESGSERVRREILKRNYSNLDVIDVVRLARKYSFKICFFNLIGVPGETLDDFRKTVEMNRICLPDRHFTSIFFPYPGTDLYSLCKKNGMLKLPLDTCMERRKATLDFPDFTKRQIFKGYLLFDYYVYRGYLPLYKILLRILVLRIKLFISQLL